MNREDFLADDSDYLFSLNKFIGKKIVDLQGYPSDPFEGAPLFNLVKVIFDDGTHVWLEGEHDVPYIPSTNELQNMDEETLEKFIERD